MHVKTVLIVVAIADCAIENRPDVSQNISRKKDSASQKLKDLHVK
jgi:hypothetical protein